MSQTPSATVESTPPSEAKLLHEQGLALARQSHFEQAIGLFQAAVEADPERVEARRHLAQAYRDAGRLAEAERAWEQYIDHLPAEPTADSEAPAGEETEKPSQPRGNREAAEAFHQLGNLRRRMEKFKPAAESLQKAADLDPASPAIQVDLGIAFAHAKRQPEARKAFERALELQADYHDALINLGTLLQQMGETDEALAHLRKAIELRPDDPSAQNNLGVVLSEQGKTDEAIACYEKLVANTPDYVLAWNNLGNALRSAGREQEAATALGKALELKPDYTEAYNNLGIIHAQLEQFDEAIRSYDQALLLRPDYPEAHANRGLVYLLMGNFQQGWADYEWRWQGDHGPKRRNYQGKMWDGSPLAGKRILLHYEQGLGDTFQFIRYAKELKGRGATVIFECQPILRQILDRTPGIDEFVIRGEKLPPYDFYAPLLSLPALCQTNLDNLPRRVPYIFADPALVWEWKQRMAQVEGFRIGVVWQGNPEHKGDRNRSIPLKCFSPLAAVPGVTLITLQKNYGVEQIEALNGLFPITDFKTVAEDVDGFLRTAAIIANLDLVISADTSVAHLAGAMGVPVWVAVQTSPDWRWLLEREDTPWYPTMRLFRQTEARNWDELFSRIAGSLRQRLSVSSKTVRDPASDVDQQEAQSLLRKAGEHLSRQEMHEAQALLEQAVQLDPTSAAIHQDLGVTYAKQGQLRDGIACFRRALELAPDSAGLYGNLGLACYQMGLFEEAVSHLRKAIWLGAGSPDTHKNLALALTAILDPASAEESYWAALRLCPNDAESHYHLAHVLLMQGKFEQGWQEYEWRWRWHNKPIRHLEKPRWAGQKIEGKRILILAEQDMRDTVQFARYADIITQQGGRAILECQPSLASLMSGCLGVERVVTTGCPLPEHDFHTSLLSLPAAFRTTLPTVPATRPYLGISTEMLAFWQKRLGRFAGLKIGIALEEEPGTDRLSQQFCMGSDSLYRFARIADISLLNLQPESEPEKSAINCISMGDLEPIPENPSEKWIATAAIVRNLDLLIAADNTIAHVAGAMGVPVWMVLSTPCDCRWLIGRDDSPWYPTMRLFRQRFRGDRDEVMGRICHMLESHQLERFTGRDVDRSSRED